MRTVLMILVLVMSPLHAAQTVYKWVDEQGVTHYSDQPRAGSQAIEINLPPRTPSPVSEPAAPTPSAITESRELPFRYTSFTIRQPSDQEFIINTGGKVTISLDVQPSLQPGHSVQVSLDGQLLKNYPADTLEYPLDAVGRGTHTVSAEIRDENDRRIKVAKDVRFVVRQESIAQPPVGPAIRQPVRPRPQPQMGNQQAPAPSQVANAAARRSVVFDPVTNMPR